ncbi:Tetratricopeptide-like helical [Penicillium paradoxum]|uniref:Tetratricopeptide-like helical n=1 Tax=Penicillium paradoxum TaxID=176176 RepID=UPI0025468B19|nr:Tetratricopeptide-like helical [Penicillium paradoxum]KAJ5794025.1 Tetratricopeptide-like helical [Penicillium paradoxum]
MAATQGADEYNLQEAWDRACTSFAQTTKVDLTAKPRFSIDEVLDQIREKQEEDNEKNNKYRAAKDVISKTLNFVTVLGGIAAEGASMVFEPSCLCFNAISYLIDTGARYKRIFSSLAELFRRISDVLERCKIYLRLPADAVDIALRKIINEELLCFVEICALSIKVLKGHKVFIALKVFAFDSDEGVSDQLVRLATLVERESQMRATLGFESQKTSERNIIDTRDGTRRVNASVDKLLSSDMRRDADSAAKRLLAGIDSSLGNPSEAFKVIQASLKRRLGDQVLGSGEWLWKDPLYTAWKSSEQSSLSLFGISGGEGYGKSFLFATIIQHLREIQSVPAEDMTYTSTAYYLFDQEKHTSLVQALKVIAWQIAKRDIVYRKDLSSVKATGVSQIASLWEILFSKAYRSDSTFFVLLDGIDQANKKELREFVQLLTELRATSETWPRFKLRVVLCGRDETMNTIKNYMGEIISVIDVASQNNDDVEKFIIDRMNRMEILSGSSDQVLALRREILENLKTQTHGDFVNVGLLLHEISGKQRPGEIRDILSRSGGKRSDTIGRKIELLNEKLSEEDIADLNIILTWVIFAAWPMQISELESVLLLKTGEASLRPLAEKITDQYASLLQIMGKPHPVTQKFSPALDVALVSDSIEEFLRNKPDSEEAETAQDLDLTGSINDSEVRIVRRFLESVCDPKLFSKFGFEEFFQRKLKGNTARVEIDTDTAHLRILETCLDVFKFKDPSGLALHNYAAYYFPQHLQQADPSLTQPQRKIALGPQLVSLFTDEKMIREWWYPDRDWFRTNWIYDDNWSEVVLKWLQDSAVTKNLTEDQSTWVKTLSSKSAPDADLLERVIKYVAHLWLEEGVANPTECFATIYGYTTKIENRKNSQIERLRSDPEPNEIEASHIINTAEWARRQLGLESLGYEGTRLMAATLREFDKYPEAIEQFKFASSLQKYNWISQWGLALCFAKQKEWGPAIEILEDAKNMVKSGDNREDDEYLPQLDRDLAKYTWETGDTAKAFAIYEAILRDNPTDYEVAFEMVICYHREKNSDGLLEFLDSLKESMDDEYGLDRRTRAFHILAFFDKYHEALLGLVCNDKTFDAVFEGYQTAIMNAEKLIAEAVLKEDDIETEHRLGQALLMQNLGALCYENGSEDAERRKLAEDQWLSILQLEVPLDALYIGHIKNSVCGKLARLYLNEACRDPSNADSYLKRLQQLASFDTGYASLNGRPSTYPTELIARYYSLQGNEEKAIDTLRSEVKHSMNLLSDDDPLNDWQGYHTLARFFMFAGQDIDSLAAWSLITPLQDADNQTDLSEPDTTKQGPTGPLNDVCDGDCETVWSFANDIYMCRECDYMELDIHCLNKLREGTLQKRICGKDHDMLHVPAYDIAQQEKIGEGNVLVGEEIMPVTEWLRHIKEKWGLQ